MKYKLSNQPLVTVCTPTFNRRPFIPMMIQCFEHQTYPKNKIEWIIIDDGTDKIEDLVKHLPQVKYISLDENKKTLGEKRNIGNDLAKGEVIVYMDDDDYYPPERISHAVKTLQKNPKALCAGSSEMFIFYKDLNKMYSCGPYGKNHSTAATFAFRKELLQFTRFNEHASIAEEREFLKQYTIPFVQLDPMKTILVFSHVHNSCDKKDLLKELETPLERRKVHESTVLPTDIIKEKKILQFFLQDIDTLLQEYELGKPENKQDVIQEIISIKTKRENHIQEMMKKQTDYQSIVQKTLNITNKSNCVLEERIEMLALENTKLKEKIIYYEEKIKQLISDKIKDKNCVNK